MYTVNSNGSVTFDPSPTFTGVATQPVTYQATDSLNRTISSTITPTVGAPPVAVAVPDAQTSAYDTNQTYTPTSNDTANSNFPISATSVKLCGISPVQTPPNCTQTSLTTADGVYTVNSNGSVTFDPSPTFTGVATQPVTYQATDSLNRTITSTITPTVNLPPLPVARPDVTTGVQGAVQTINLLTDPNGLDAPGAVGVSLNAASVKLCAVADPLASPAVVAQVAPNCTKTTVTITNVGTYSVDSSGVMTFTPVASFTGTAPALPYTVADTFGQKVASTYTPTVIAAPTVLPDISTGPWNTAQSRNVLTNTVGTSDHAGTGASLVASSVVLSCAGAANCTVNSDGSVTIANEGTYTISQANDGTVIFTPLATFVGTATPVTYTVTDNKVQTGTTTYTPTVTSPTAPVANPDVKTVLPGATVSFMTITDSTPTGTDLASGAQLQTSGIHATCLLTPGTTICDADGIVTIAGEGTFTLDPSTGIVAYTADANATVGTKTSISYLVTDVVGQTATSTLTPVIPAGPSASPDYSRGEQGATQFISLLGNDRPGAVAADLNPASVFLCSSTQASPNCTATTVTVPGEGTYTVSNLGTIMFVPDPGFVGTATPINYQVSDNLNQTATSSIHVVVIPPPSPIATPDTGSASFNHSVTLQPWINDAPGTKGSGLTEPNPNIVPSSIRLCDVGQNVPHCTATSVTTDDGTYVLNPTTGVVVFTPIDGFVGTVTSPVTYQIRNDWTGASGPGTSTSLLIPTIMPPGAPAATVDITTTKPGIAVIINPMDNDIPGYAVLDPTTVRLCSTVELAPNCTQTTVTNADGTYTVDTSTGLVTFMPAIGFTGQASIPYRIADLRGMVTNSNIIITVKDVVVPVVHKKKAPKVVHQPLAKTGYEGPSPLALAVLMLIGFALVIGRRKRD